MPNIPNIDFKNHEEFAKFVFDNASLQDALQSQFGNFLPPGPLGQEDQTYALINSIPSFLKTLSSSDELNLSQNAPAANNNNINQSKHNNPAEFDFLPPPPPPKPN